MKFIIIDRNPERGQQLQRTITNQNILAEWVESIDKLMMNKKFGSNTFLLAHDKDIIGRDVHFIISEHILRYVGGTELESPDVLYLAYGDEFSQGDWIEFFQEWEKTEDGPPVHILKRTHIRALLTQLAPFCIIDQLVNLNDITTKSLNSSVASWWSSQEMNWQVNLMNFLSKQEIKGTPEEKEWFETAVKWLRQIGSKSLRDALPPIKNIHLIARRFL